MLNLAVARRYARALFDLSSESGQIDQIDNELNNLVSLIESNPQLQALMNDVLTVPKVKSGIVSRLFEGKFSPLLMNFILLVVRKRRESHFPQFYRAYLDLAHEARGIVEVEVRSAVELAPETLNALEARLGAKLGKRIKFQTLVVPELLGGLVLRVGDELMDGSIKTRLDNLRKQMVLTRA